MAKDIIKNIVSETSAAVLIKGFSSLASLAGLPWLSIPLPLAKGLVLGIVENCFNNCSQMSLSVKEQDKLKQVSLIALQTFRELAEKDGVTAWEINIDPALIDYSYEVAEHITLEAIRQSERKKIDILGRYYGKQFYNSNTDWQDMHQIITMVGNLTFRQLSMIRLISEGFKGFDGDLFIGNPSACVEINRLKDYGIWQTQGASFGINESWPMRLDSIIATLYSDQVKEELMLSSISDDDIQRTIDSLHLTKDGNPLVELTEEAFKKSTSYYVDGNTLVLPGGIRLGTNEDPDLNYDLMRGK